MANKKCYAFQKYRDAKGIKFFVATARIQSAAISQATLIKMDGFEFVGPGKRERAESLLHLNNR
jgi:hypothetical protein